MKTTLSKFLRSGVAALVAMASFFQVSSLQPANAATLTVNTLLDEADGSCSNGDCSLRDAIALVNPGDTIQFAVSGVIHLTLGQITFARSLTLAGPGAARLKLNGANSSRIFELSGGSSQIVAISDLSFSGGSSGSQSGGAILNWNILGAGSLTVRNCAFDSNKTNNNGGAIHSMGPLIVQNSLFTNNYAKNNGGAISNSFYSLIISNSRFLNNSTDQDAGAVYSDGTSGLPATLTTSDSYFQANTAARLGGAIKNDHDSQAEISTSYFYKNTAGSEGGAINNEGSMNVVRSSFIENATAATSNTRGGAISTGGALSLTNSTIARNKVGSAGGAVYYDYDGSGTILNSTLAGNGLLLPGAAGGIYTNYVTVTIKNSIIANNGTGGNCSGPGFTAATANNLSDTNLCGPGFSVKTLAQIALVPHGSWYNLGAGSAAIDAGSTADCPPVDQRGWLRPQDGNQDANPVCDIGAIEMPPHPVDVFLSAINR